MNLKWIAILLPLWWTLRVASKAGVGPGEVHAGAGEDGGQMRLSPGQALVVRLEAHFSAGYRWEIDRLDGAALQAAGEPESLPPAGPPGRLGAPGSQVFRFLAAAPGEAFLQLAYRRRWAQDAPPTQVYSLKIVVK